MYFGYLGIYSHDILSRRPNRVVSYRVWQLQNRTLGI
jgi:hypothetical protein